MFKYEISSGDPEGTSWTLNIEHEKEYSSEEFTKIAESAFIESYKREYDREKVVYPESMPDSDIILQILIEQGFVAEQPKTAYYYFEPYFGGDSLCEDLKNAIKYYSELKDE